MDARRPVEVSFTAVYAAARQTSEDAHLVYADRCLAAVLLPAEQGWFMQAGFGPCDHEAMFFDTLSAAADWVSACFAAVSSASGKKGPGGVNPATNA